AAVWLPDPKMKTLGEKGIECIFVGYVKHSKASRFYVIEPNDLVAINSIIESKDAIFNEHRYSSVPRPSQRSLVKGTEDSGGSVVSERVTAIKSQDVAFWKEAINDEMDSIMGNNTWVLTDLPSGCRPLGCKWIFKRKMKIDRTVEKFKARLVIQGFNQKSGIDYFDTYALVTRISTIRLLIAMTSIHNLIIHQMDVKTTFLNGYLEEEVYMNQPLGFILPGNENNVFKLIKSLYGLKQAPKQCHQNFDEVVLSDGYLLNQADTCVYSKFDASEILSSRFSMKDMGEVDVILGIRIKLESNGIAISQFHYIEKVLKKFNYSDRTPVNTPLDTCEKLMLNRGQAVSQLEYSIVIGCLMHAMTCTILHLLWENWIVSPHSGHGRLTNRHYPGVRDTVQLETAVNTISHEYLLDFTSEYGIPETLHPELPGPEDRIVDFPEGKGGCPLAKGRGRILPNVTPSHWILKNWNNRFFCVDERVFPTIVDWRTNASKDRMPAEGTYSVEAVRALDTHHMDLFNLIRASNPTNVKVGSRPRALHEVPLLTLTANRVIEIDDPTGTAAPEMPPSEDVPATVAPGTGQAKEFAAVDPPVAAESRKRGRDGIDSLAAIQLGLTSTASVPEDAPTGICDPDSLSFADPLARPPADVTQSSQGIATAGDPESKNASSPAEVGSSKSVYRPEWGVTNGNLLDTPEACQDLVDHVAPPGYFFELRHMHNDEFLRQYNVNLARQVAIGSRLRLRFEQEAKLLRKSVAQVARRDRRIQARELETKNLEALLEAEANTKKAAKDTSAGLSQELEIRVSGEEKRKASFEEFKWQQDERVEQRCAEIDARLDALSIDFDEELYPHMLIAIAGRRWVIGRRLRLAVMKCDESLELRQAFVDAVSMGIAKGLSEGLRHGLEHGQAQRSLESIKAYDPEAEAKFVAALQALKDLKYPLVDQLESLKDAPMDVIMAALYLESDIGDDASQDIRDLCPSSSQLTISVYPEVRDPRNPWACKEEIVLADAIAANISRAEKKKKCRIVCRTHGVGSAHHARSDGVSVSAPTVVPQGLALLLADAATQTV
nr:zinc finger, CCHC-type [Tanacetum cinerariifolium]